MNPETINAIKDALSPLATSLGTTVEQVYTVYVAQMKYEGFADLLLGLIEVGLVFIAYRFTRYFFFKDNGEYQPWSIVFGVLTLVFIVCALFDIYHGVGKTINPQYYAVQEFINQIRSAQ